MSERVEIQDDAEQRTELRRTPPGWRRMRWAMISLLPVIAVALTVFVVAVVSWQQSATPEARYRRARQALIEGERDVVLHEAERLIHTPGYPPNGFLLRGLLLARAGKRDEAVLNLQLATAKESLVVEASTIAARCFYESGRYLPAIDAAIVALHHDPKCIDARRWLAAAYYDLGANGQAVQELQRISDEALADPGPDRLLGLIAKDGEQFATAISHYQKSLQRNPQPPERESVLQELAESQIKLGKFDDARATLQGCQKSAVVLGLEANCQIGLGRFDEAKNLLRESLKLDPRGFPALLTLGKLLLDQGQAGEALQVLTEAAAIMPQNSQVHFQLSQALSAAGKADAADDESRRMLEIQALEREFSDLHLKASEQPNDASIRSRIGELAIQLGKPELAKVWFRAALALDPADARARSALTGANKSQSAEPVRRR